MGYSNQQDNPKNPPPWMTGPSELTGNWFLDLIVVSVGFIVLGLCIILCIIATVLAASLTMAALSVLIKLITQGMPANVLQNILLSVVAGVFAGIATVIVRSWGRKPGHLEKSFLSALFAKGLEAPPYDEVFLGRVLVGGVVGMFVGLVAGASGVLSIPQVLSGASHEILINTAYPIYETIVNITGGTGGAGGGSEFNWFMLIAVAVALIFMALLLGVVSGFVVHIIVSGIAGLMKGTAKEIIIAVLEEKNKDLGSNNPAPLIVGMLRGLLIGLVSGILMAVSTIWGIVRFF